VQALSLKMQSEGQTHTRGSGWLKLGSYTRLPSWWI